MDSQTLQIHRTPGRLRVRSPQLKENPAHALDAKLRLARVKGVRTVELNRLTGSLLIHFDPMASTPETLVETVLSAGNAGGAGMTRVAGIGRADRGVVARPMYSRATRKAAKVACTFAGEKVLEALVETLAGALITALL